MFDRERGARLPFLAFIGLPGQHVDPSVELTPQLLKTASFSLRTTIS